MVDIAFANFSCSILLPLKSCVLQGNLPIHSKSGSVQTTDFCPNPHFVILVLRRRHCSFDVFVCLNVAQQNHKLIDIGRGALNEWAELFEERMSPFHPS